MTAAPSTRVRPPAVPERHAVRHDPRPGDRRADRDRDTSDAAFKDLVGAEEFGEVFLRNVERTGVGMAVLDPNLRIQETNAAFLDHCGRPPVDLRHRCISELLHPSVRQPVLRQFVRLIQGHGGRFMEQLPAVWATQTAFSGSLTGMALRSETGQLKTVVVLVTPERFESETRVLISPNKIVKRIDAHILEGVATGVTTVQLAANLYLSRQGIEYHVSNMLRQFKVPNRASLISKAYSMGLFGVGVWPPKVVDEYIQD